MIVTDPVSWLLDRLGRDAGTFAVRFNDGEHAMMFRTCADGAPSSDDSHMTYAIGDALADVLRQLSFADPDRVLLGCDWWYDFKDALNNKFELSLIGHGMVPDNADESLAKESRFHFARGHWPLEAVADGSVYRLLDALRARGNVVFVSHEGARGAAACMGAEFVLCRPADSYETQHHVQAKAWPLAHQGKTFVWAGGYGLKPLMHDLWDAAPQSTHIDVGHLFDPAFGRVDRSWVADPRHPWHAPYFDRFVPYVKGFK